MLIGRGSIRFIWFHPAVPPDISSRGGPVTVLVNQPARLECEATGVPPPSFTWLKDGSPVASGLRGLQVGGSCRRSSEPDGNNDPSRRHLRPNL